MFVGSLPYGDECSSCRSATRVPSVLALSRRRSPDGDATVMPWGHAAFGYVLYSLGHRLVTRKAPTAAAVVAVLFGTQLPDLVDKPLSWGLHLFPQGYSVAHSLFVAIPVGLLALLVAARSGRSTVGIAFAVGYWSHLLGDVILAVPKRNVAPLDRVLWPVVTLPPYDHETTLFGRVFDILGGFLHSLTARQQLVFLGVYSIPYLFAFLLWLVDGAPGVGELRRAITGE
ncbi:metal-dependent hydrolase [Haladaptatus halobius]|uniref:metal-dependent hydrolase n=1 Tax=Haladaptatus halobius TaxID=2884875 RepID=UPI001D0B83DA|nr:metal-dependent hydrolase [Haladaptatus halobius]